MKLIPLTKGQFAQVDDWNYTRFMLWVWRALKVRNTYYAVRTDYVNGKIKNIFMHREILNPPPNLKTDHRDHNGLNNQEYNLRNCTNRQNLQNSLKQKRSLYKGVSFHCYRNKYKYFRADIRVNGKLIGLGLFKNAIKAAQAYDNAAKNYFGEFANLNFK